MNRISIGLAIGIAALGAGGSLASAATITVYVKEAGFAAQSMVVSAPQGDFLFDYHNFKIIGGYATDNLGGQLTSSVQVTALSSGRGKSLVVDVVETGLPSVRETDFVTSYSDNAMPKGWTLTEATLYGCKNAAYPACTGTTDIYDPETGVSTGATTGVNSGAFIGGGPSSLLTSAPYVIQEMYTYSLSSTATISKSSNSGVTLMYAPVPEASTWAMLGLGFAAIGFVGVRQRRGSRYAV